MPDRPKKAVDLASTVANNASRRAWTRLELPSHQGSLQQAKMDNDGRIWTNLILLRIRCSTKQVRARCVPDRAVNAGKSRSLPDSPIPRPTWAWAG
jgi:hypothetical protein